MRIGKAINAATPREKQLEKDENNLRNTKSKHKTHAKEKMAKNKNYSPHNAHRRLLKPEKETLPEKQRGKQEPSSRTKIAKKGTSIRS